VIISCLRCDVAMEEGFIPDLADLNYPQVPQWAEGRPVKSFWSGLKLKDRDRYPITTYRCPKCGMLQSYARAEGS
jgi:hypothetical protein